MSIKLSSHGLTANGTTPVQHLLVFIDSVLRGVGQVMLQNNSYAGLLFLIGIFWNSALFGVAVLVGTSVSTATAMLLAAKPSLVREGHFGFNGALVAIAIMYFLQPEALTWAYVIFAAACTTIVSAAMRRAMDTWNVPPLTAPFVLTTLCFVLACARFGRLHSTHILPTAGLPKAAIVEGVVTTSTVVQGFFNGIAQVFFQHNVITGVLFIAGLLVSSRVSCLMAALGSFTGLLVAWGMGAAEPAIRAGAFGFNCVLTAIALGSVLFVLEKTAAACALLGTIAAAVVFAAISAALEPLGMPALTLPFVLVVWFFALASPLFPKLRAPPSVDPSNA
jgi:urea transporter